MLWWWRTFTLEQPRHGQSTGPAFAAAIWLYLVLGFIRPILMGSWSEAVPFGIFPPRLDGSILTTIRKPVLQPFHMWSIFFLYGSAVLFAMHGATILATSRYGADREIDQIIDRGTQLSVVPCSGVGPWVSTPRWSHSLGAWWFGVLTVTGGIGILLTGTVVENWYPWGMKHGRFLSNDWRSSRRSTTDRGCTMKTLTTKLFATVGLGTALLLGGCEMPPPESTQWAMRHWYGGRIQSRSAQDIADNNIAPARCRLFPPFEEGKGRLRMSRYWVISR